MFVNPEENVFLNCGEKKVTRKEQQVVGKLGSTVNTSPTQNDI